MDVDYVVSDKDLAQLLSAFPGFDEEVVKSILEYCSGDVEAAVTRLSEIGSPGPEAPLPPKRKASRDEGGMSSGASPSGRIVLDLTDSEPMLKKKSPSVATSTSSSTRTGSGAPMMPGSGVSTMPELRQARRENEMLREAAAERDALILSMLGEQQTCIICLEKHTQGLICESRNHFICTECAPREVKRILEVIQDSPETLSTHRRQGGRIKCVDPGCTTTFTDRGLACALPEHLFNQYQAARDQVTEQKIFTHLQEQFQNELKRLTSESKGQRTAQEAKETAEFLRRTYPNAVQCPRCSAGPVIPEGCPDLQSHHGQSSGPGQGRISNACSGCGFFAREKSAWAKWDGKLAQA